MTDSRYRACWEGRRQRRHKAREKVEWRWGVMGRDQRERRVAMRGEGQGPERKESGDEG